MLKNTLKYFSCEQNLSKESAKYSLSLWLSVIILFIAGFALKTLVPDVFNPDIPKLFLAADKMFVAEQSEKAAFYGVVFLMPFALFFSYFLLSKHGGRFLAKLDDKWLLCGSFAVMLLLIFFTFERNNFLPFVFDKFYFTLAAFILGLGLIYLQSAAGKRARFYFTAFILFGAAAVVVKVFMLYLVPLYVQDASCPYHFEAYYFPIYKVLSGQALGYNYNSVYGFYPYIYEVIFKFIGPVSVFKVSIINAFLICSGISAVGYFLWKALQNKVFWLFCFCAYVFSVVGKLWGGYYLQFQPHRLLFLSFTLALCAFYYQAAQKTQKILYYCGFLLCALAVFWNIESGFICLAVWGGFLSYLEFMRGGFYGRKTYLRVFKACVLAASAVFLAFAVLFLISYVKTGKVLPFKNILEPYLFFYKYGYMMLKMKWYHPWFLLGVIYLISLSKALFSLLRGQAKGRELFLFILTIVGVTIFPYYQGRSHILVFSAVYFPAVLILALLAESYLKEFSVFIKDKTADGRFICCFNAAKFILIFFFGVFMTVKVADLLFVSDKLFKYRNQTGYPLLFKNEEIAWLVPPSAPVTLFTYDNAVHYTLRGQKDDTPLTEEYFMFEDYLRVINYLLSPSRPVVFENEIFSLFQKYSKELFEGVLLEYWQYNNRTPHFISFTPKKAFAPPQEQGGGSPSGS